MKKCQFCAEEIQDEAIKCKHCGSEVIVSRSLQIQPPKKNLRFGVIAFSAILVIFLGYQGVVYKEKQNVVAKVMNAYGYTPDAYTFNLKSYRIGVISSATLVVTASKEDVSWDVKVLKKDGKWELETNYYVENDRDLRMLQEALSGLPASGAVGSNVYIRKEDGDEFRRQVKVYNLKHPKSKVDINL